MAEEKWRLTVSGPDLTEHRDFGSEKAAQDYLNTEVDPRYRKRATIRRIA